MAQYELNLSDYARIIRKRKLIIIASFIVVAISSTLFSSKEEPIYQAETTVKIQFSQTVAGLLTEWITTNPGELIPSEAKAIKAFPIVQKVAMRLGITNNKSSQDEIYAAVSELQGSIETNIVETTNIIRITVTNHDPKKAMDIANTTAQVYVEENLLEKNKQARAARQFIEEQLTSLQERLKDTEGRLASFGEEAKGIKMTPAIQDKLVELQFEMGSLLQKYTEKHPSVRQIRDQITSLEAQLKGFSGQELEYARLLREDDVNKKLYAMLREKLEEARINEAQKVSSISIVDPAILPTDPINPEQKFGILIGGLLGLIIGFFLAFITESLDTSIGTIEDVESVTKLPVLGVVPSIRGEPPKKEKTGFKKYLHILFPPKPTAIDEAYIRLMVHNQPKSTISEAYRAIRTNLKLGSAVKTILITSATAGEGKTTLLTNLGLAIAQTGAKTLLVSSDLRRPAVAKSFGLKEDNGLTEVITKAITIDDAICNISDIMLGELKLDKIIEAPGIENIYILSSGRIPVNPAELLGSKDMINLVEDLKKRFEIILFDSPPALPITDATLLAPKVDGIVLIYEAGRTARSALLRAKTQLELAGGKILGVVLNHIKPQSASAASYPYYYSKYKYYGDKPDKKEKKSVEDKKPV